MLEKSKNGFYASTQCCHMNVKRLLIKTSELHLQFVSKERHTTLALSTWSKIEIDLDHEKQIKGMMSVLRSQSFEFQ